MSGMSMSISVVRSTPTSVLKDIQWHEGPPPSYGWWPVVRKGASHNAHEFPKYFRFFYPPSTAYPEHPNGYWGLPFSSEAAITLINQTAFIKSGCSQESIFWTERPSNWPKESYT